ncbi:hypothetical protein RHSIM_Rhsim04G0137300 [Rhododendron simsii]|uniref:Uncharacterized protein n=1 Tax=Rhododendron simsii TaxID=118357 RepID=A0A834H8B0_RHOSS|nr:hypothetical protein RHSIM_Rhsim04G0137300 [Rhododendron simsii]
MESHDEHRQEERPGVIGTILKSVAETLESAKEAIIGKSYDEPREGGYEEQAQEEERGITDRAVKKAGEMKEVAKEKAETAKEMAKETAELATEKAKETTESVAEKARQAKETVMGKQKASEKAGEKGGEYKDYTMEKAEESKERAKETKDSGVGKISEKAKRAMETLTGGEAAISSSLKSRNQQKFQFWVMLMEFVMFTLTNVDKSANMEMAKNIVLDSKMDYPAVCNAMETLLVHKDLVQTGAIHELIVELQIKGVAIHGGPKASSLMNIPEARSFHHKYSALACTVEIVDDVYAAIDHIHCHGRHVDISNFSNPFLAHTDSIITEDNEVAETFLKQVDRYHVLLFLFDRSYMPPTELDLLVSAVLLYSRMQAQDLLMGLVLDLVQW